MTAAVPTRRAARRRASAAGTIRDRRTSRSSRRSRRGEEGDDGDDDDDDDDDDDANAANDVVVVVVEEVANAVAVEEVAGAAVVVDPPARSRSTRAGRRTRHPAAPTPPAAHVAATRSPGEDRLAIIAAARYMV